MKNDKEKWINEVLESTKGMQRTSAPAHLFKKIESQIGQGEAKVIPMTQLRIAAAAAVILCWMNVSILYQQAKNTILHSQELVIDDTPDLQLISTNRNNISARFGYSYSCTST